MSLKQHLIRLIQTQGPLPVSQYMAEALGHPVHGYYMTKDPFGARGDFITAPEVSQMFGELVGLWAADYWQRMGSPSRFALIEAGPGRGTLMADILRTWAGVPDLHKAAQVHLIEMSMKLRASQKTRLADHTDISPFWHDDVASALEATRDMPVIFVANEFFDALPIRQFIRKPAGWHERLVGYAEDKLIPVLSPTPSPAAALIPEALRDAPFESQVEVCPAALSISGAIASALKDRGGVALMIDYGYTKSQPGDSLQALASHTFVDIFEEPGKADITAHVDFEALARAAEGAAIFQPIDQGEFLTSLGIHARANALKVRATEVQSNDINAAMTRLCSPDQMGNLFKVMAIAGPDSPVPAGFGEEKYP